MGSMRASLPLAVVFALACPAAALAADAPRCTLPSAGDWHEYRTKHFVVDTDVGRTKAELLIGRLEKMHGLVVTALVGEVVDIPGRVRVVAPSDPGFFQALAAYDRDISAFFTITRMSEPVIVLPVGGVEADVTTVAHELAHHVSWYLFPRQPHWFSEGLAQFVETVANEDAEQAPELGSHIARGDRSRAGAAGVASRRIQRRLELARPFSAKELFDWRGDPADDSVGSFHTWSWMLYHWLWNTRSKQLTDFSGRLSNGEDPARAWSAVFPEFSPSREGALERLDDAVTRYRRDGRYAFYKIPAPAPEARFEEARFTSSDAHVFLLAARQFKSDKDAAEVGHAQLDEALREDPSQPVAIAWRAALDHASPVEALRAAVKARPADARAFYELAAALDEKKDAAEKEAMYRKAVALDQDSARAQNGLAWQLAMTGRAREALPFANRAVDLAPWNAGIIDTLATVAVEIGQCKQGLELEHRAVELAGPRSSIAKRLGELEARCAARPGDATQVSAPAPAAAPTVVPVPAAPSR
jgi:tetratricopeptide (TPR) repeat protein